MTPCTGLGVFLALATLAVSASASGQPDQLPMEPGGESRHAAPEPAEAYLERVEPAPLEAALPERRRNLFDIVLRAGGSAGGDRVYTDTVSRETLDAGTSITFTFGTRTTPIRWKGKSLGLTVEYGVRGWSLGSNQRKGYQANLTRFPLIASTHFGIELLPGMDLVLALGLQHEPRVRLSGQGRLASLSETFNGGLGGLVEIGSVLDAGAGGTDISLRYTRIGYDRNGEAIDASSLGIFIALHLTPLSMPLPP
jgi:hypothetical protein